MPNQDIETGTYIVHAHCPNCGGSELVLVGLREVLTVAADDDSSTLKVRLKSKGVDHICHQESIQVDIGTGEITLPTT